MAARQPRYILSAFLPAPIFTNTLTAHHSFNQALLLDTTPLPSSIPPVTEIGASSAPLLSAAYFIGARCRPFNDDYMKCKTDAHGRGEFECMREGRKVTRCAASVLEDINRNCLDEFRRHWNCLENNNQQLWQCRKHEWKLNGCVSGVAVRYEKRLLIWSVQKLEKKIPDAPANETPVHLRKRQIYSHNEPGVIT
ncbi:MAG: hypothetical protein L6R35_001513 [Caloplaca aegaea]|nr:MAG: hypothetical protein L6R35_001513 [Caloplaca aegaea]